MHIGELCLATISTSDNSAANLLTHQIGGLETLRHFIKLSGDQVTRFDRLEPFLNIKEYAHDERDTSTAIAMSTLLNTLLHGSLLNKTNKEILKSWMRATTTGFARIRASLPKNWDIGNKTGTSGEGTANDVAFFTTHKGHSYCLTVFSERQGEDNDLSNHAIAKATKHVVKLIS